MAEQVSADTFEYTLNGRVLIFKKSQLSQIVMLNRYVDRLQQQAAAMFDSKDLDGILAINRKINEATWAAVESQFTRTEDLEWVQMEIIARRLDEGDLLPLLSNGIKKADIPDDADPAPVKKPGRKAPAKKAAKKAPTRRAAS